MEGINKALRYLRYTLNYGWHYTRYLTVLEGYGNTNWISDTKDSKSTSGYVFIMVNEQCHGNPLNKLVWLDPLWNPSL